jgi:hypothetical protein
MGDGNDFCSTKRVFIWREIAQYFIVFVFVPFTTSATPDATDNSKLRVELKTCRQQFGPGTRISSKQPGLQEATQEFQTVEACG